ncbi:MAG: 23S ribosomal RNA methyltransferase Erm [Firmicutes bacterium]|nr:23S ribosomal RNA methyltransferase Erm [Bacillota bacterium]
MRVSGIRIPQNFLTSRRTIERLLRLTNISKNDHIVEIGPGKGHITGPLLDACGRLTAVEIDGGLCDILEAKFQGRRNLALRRADFLKWPLPASEYKVFANIPFSRTTEILRKLAGSRNPPAEAWLVMEKGAAKGFMGIPKEDRRSLMTKPVFDMEIVWRFRREDFHPAPAADAVLLHLKRKERPDVPFGLRREYERFLTLALRNNGLGLSRILTKRQIAAALREAGERDARSGEILYVQWLCLFRRARESGL